MYADIGTYNEVGLNINYAPDSSFAKNGDKSYKRNFANRNESYENNIIINANHTHSGTTESVWEKYGSANTSGMSANENHSHTVNGGGNGTASGNAHENMPPYIAKYCWERVS